MPVHIYFRQLHQRSLLRVATLSPTHILVHASSIPGMRRTVPNDTLRTYAAFLRNIPSRVSLPLHEISAFRLDDDEPFAPTHKECQPGARVRDLFSERVFHHT
jgi:hypothetical protein